MLRICVLLAGAAAAAAGPGSGGGGGGFSLLDDGLGGLDALLGPTAVPASSNGANSGPSLALTAGFKLMPGIFQEQWRKLNAVQQYTEGLNMATVAALAANGHKDFGSHMGQANVSTMASGGQPPMYR
jgi:hypothetical protein